MLGGGRVGSLWLPDRDPQQDQKPLGWPCRSQCSVRPEGVDSPPTGRWIFGLASGAASLGTGPSSAVWPAEECTGIPAGGPAVTTACTVEGEAASLPPGYLTSLLVAVPIAGRGSQQAEGFERARLEP